ncbi:Asteroid like protein, partial [Aduncisulcus paluster]
MGILGLISYVKTIPGIIEKVSLHNLACEEKGKLKLCIDGESILYSLIQNNTDTSFGGESASLQETTRRFFTSLQNSGANCYVLMSGVYSHENDHGLQARAENRIHIKKEFISTAESRFRKRERTPFIMPIMARRVFMQTLDEMGIKYRVVDAETIRYVAGTAKANKCFCVGFHSNFLCMEDIKGYIHSDSIATTREGDVMMRVAVPSRIAENLRLPPSRLPLLATLLSNDAVPSW